MAIDLMFCFKSLFNIFLAVKSLHGCAKQYCVVLISPLIADLLQELACYFLTLRFS